MKQLLQLTLLLGFALSTKAQNTSSGQAIFDLLTGGDKFPNGKSWKMLDEQGASGLGPWRKTRVDLSFYNYPDGLSITPAWANGALKNAYTFRYDSVYKPLNQNVTANWFLANYYLGTNQAQYDDVALVDSNHKEAKFSFVYTSFFTGYSIIINNNSYIGYFDKRNQYEIISVNADTLRLRHKYNDNPDNQDFLDPNLDASTRFSTFISTTITALVENNQTQEYEIDFYPNPSSGSINISNRYLSVTIYNQFGELLLTSNSRIVNTNDLPSGVYQIKLVDKSGNFSWKKLIVN
jgi:hypothetical protein